MTNPTINVLDQATLARLFRVMRIVEAAEKGGAPAHVPTITARTTALLNASGYTIPQYGCAWLKGTSSGHVDGIVQVYRPEGSVTSRLLIAVGEVGIGSRGSGYTDGIQRVRVSDYSTLAIGDRIGTQANSFDLHAVASGPLEVVAKIADPVLLAQFVGGGETAPGTLFPITMACTNANGHEGSATAQCSYVYTVTNAITSEQLGTNVNPTTGYHKHQRPTFGFMLQATFGMAYVDSGDHLVITYCNEQADAEACVGA